MGLHLHSSVNFGKGAQGPCRIQFLKYTNIRRGGSWIGNWKLQILAVWRSHIYHEQVRVNKIDDTKMMPKISSGTDFCILIYWNTAFCFNKLNPLKNWSPKLMKTREICWSSHSNHCMNKILWQQHFSWRGTSKFSYHQPWARICYSSLNCSWILGMTRDTKFNTDISMK